LEDIEAVDENGKGTGTKVKNRVFPNINNYLFYLNGEYYEVEDDGWKQTD
jgi:hypothetical protein